MNFYKQALEPFEEAVTHPPLVAQQHGGGPVYVQRIGLCHVPAEKMRPGPAPLGAQRI